jgi:hypothetical protein
MRWHNRGVEGSPSLHGRLQSDSHHQEKLGTEWPAIRKANVLFGKLTCGAWEANPFLPVRITVIPAIIPAIPTGNSMESAVPRGRRAPVLREDGLAHRSRHCWMRPDYLRKTNRGGRNLFLTKLSIEDFYSQTKFRGKL